MKKRKWKMVEVDESSISDFETTALTEEFDDDDKIILDKKDYEELKGDARELQNRGIQNGYVVGNFLFGLYHSLRNKR